MSKPTPLDQMQRVLDFIRVYAEQHPDFRQQMEAALSAPVDKKPKPMTPHEYVDEHGLAAFKTHVQEADLNTLMSYARRLKLKVSRGKQPPLDSLRQTIIDTMETLMKKGSVFASHS